MEIAKNAAVINREGTKLGHVDRVVIDPKTKEISDLVVQKGLLFKTDKVVPLRMFRRIDENQLEITQDTDELERLPDFEETHHIPARSYSPGMGGNRQQAQPLYWYSMIPTRVWWGVHSGYTQYPRYAVPDYVVTTQQNIPEGSVPMEEGAKVISADGEHIGNVEKIYTATAENRAVYLVVSKGLLLKTTKLVPTVWVKHILEDEVHLSVETSVIADLPEYEYE